MKKKYLAYCLALSMVLSTSAPVLASEQVDVVAESVEEPDVTVDSEIETIEPEDDVAVFENNSILTESEQESVENSAIDSFDDGSDSTDCASEEDGWIQSEEVTGLSFKYDSSNQTFYMKSSIPVALPDNTQSGWTSEWRNKYGVPVYKSRTSSFWLSAWAPVPLQVYVSVWQRQRLWPTAGSAVCTELIL